MDRDERVRAQRQLVAHPEVGREGLAGVPCEPENLRAELAQPLLREVLGRRVHRCEVGRLGLPVEVVRGDGEPELVRAASQPDLGAGAESLLEPRLVEPRRLDLTRSIGHSRGQDPEPPAAATRHRADDDLDHRLLIPEEVADLLRRNGLLVPAGPLPEEVTGALEPEPGKPAAQRRADAGETLERRIESLRPRGAARARPPVREVDTREACRPRRCSRPLHGGPL